MSESAEVVIQRVDPKEDNRPWKVTDGNDKTYATFKDDIGKLASTLVGRKARVHFTEKTVTKDGRDFTNTYLDKLEGPLAENGDHPPLGTGEYVKGQTAPKDAERMARAAAWKAVGGDGAILKAVLSAHSVEATGQMTVQNVLDLSSRTARYITNSILGDESIPF